MEAVVWHPTVANVPPGGQAPAVIMVSRSRVKHKRTVRAEEGGIPE